VVIKKEVVKKEADKKVKEDKKVKTKAGQDKPYEVTIGGREILLNNRKQYVISKKGDTYEKLTKEFEKLSWELYRFNDVEKGASLEPGVKVYLQPKRNNAERGFDTHTVKEGETLYSIAQFYGVKVKSLMKKNYLSASEKLRPGDIIYLRKTKPKTE
jgi:LysM repeat protein